MYVEIYNLLVQWLYGSAVMTTHMELTATVLATIAVIAVIALPFCALWNVCRWFMSGLR